MGMLESIFSDNFFDNLMNYPLEKYFQEPNSNAGKNFPLAIKTDIKENDGNYEIEMDLPGISKENVKIEISDGYLNVTACRCSELNQGDCNHNYIRKERYTGNYRRSFFVGKHISFYDIKAKFENGVLYISFPKKDPKETEENRFIEIQ